MTCILIAGVPAGGKTTFAKFLQKELSLPMMSKDGIKEQLFETVGFQSREQKVALGIASFSLLCCFAEAQMQAGKSCILENNFENLSRKPLETLLKRYGCRAVTVLFTGDLKAVYRRFVRRESDPSRHLGHVSNTCYPLRPGEAPGPPPDEAAFCHGIHARGIDCFDLGDRVIHADCTDLAALDYSALAKQVKDALAALQNA